MPKLKKFINWFLALFAEKPKEHWLLVRTYTVEATKTTTNHRGDVVGKPLDGKVFFYMFESDKGNRKVEFGSTFSDFDPSGEKYKVLSEWADYIYPWLSGRHLKNTPSYSEAQSFDVATKLSES